MKDIIFDINRLVLNFLSSIHTFLDHTETYIKRTYGKKPKESQNFEKTTNSYFDTYFSYRLLSKLRNYSQHVGMPMTCLTATSKMVNPDQMEYNHVLETIALKDESLKFDDFDWGKYTELDELGNPNKLEIKDEISLLPEKIDIGQYIDEMVNCLELIYHTPFVKNEFENLLQYNEFLNELVKEADEFIKLTKNPVFLEKLAHEVGEYVNWEKSVKEASDIIPCIFVEIQDFSKS